MSAGTVAVQVATQDGQRKGATIGYYLSFVGLGLVAASLGPTLPGLATNTDTQLSAISVLFTARALGYMAGSMVAGWVYDRYRGHPIVAGAILLMALLMAFVPFVPLLLILIAILFVMGLAEGTMDVGVNTLIVWLHRPNVGPVMNALHFFFGIGAFLSPLIVAQVVLASGGIDWVYWSIAIVLLPIALWIARLPSPSARSADATSADGPIDVLLTGLTILFLFVYVGVELSFSGWIYTYAVEQTHFTAAQAAYLNSGFWGSFYAGATGLDSLYRPASPALFAVGRDDPSHLLCRPDAPLADVKRCALDRRVRHRAGNRVDLSCDADVGRSPYADHWPSYELVLFRRQHWGNVLPLVYWPIL
ncbi:MAG: MFS transporter [Caldilineaceae bacterium]